MTNSILNKILEAKRARVATARRNTDFAELKKRASEVRLSAKTHRLRSALKRSNNVNVIAEFKRASPSKGAINIGADAAAIAKLYRAGGACALSVLTEEDHFQGSLADLDAVRDAVDLPILRKDFIFDEFQILESAAAGADAILLIVSVLDVVDLMRLRKLAHGLGLDAVVEVHDADEFAVAMSIDADIIGINNRNLNTFEVSLDVSRKLIADKPAGILAISESGIDSSDDVRELRSLGFDGFLIGETLMRNVDPRALLEDWI